jgi:hypothetical protein
LSNNHKTYTNTTLYGGHWVQLGFPRPISVISFSFFNPSVGSLPSKLAEYHRTRLEMLMQHHLFLETLVVLGSNTSANASWVLMKTTTANATGTANIFKHTSLLNALKISRTS